MSEFNNLNIFVQQSKSYFSDIASKSVKVGAENISYYEAGAGETLLFLHCFNGNKSLWRILINKLKDNYHIIAPDLPGFSNEDNISDQSLFSFRYLIEVVDAFTKVLDLKAFHLISASAGSTLAACYTLKHASKVKTLSMYGLPSLFREQSELHDTQPKEADFFVPTTLKDQHSLNDFLIYGTNRISTWMMTRLVEVNRRHKDYKISVLNEALKNTSLIVPRLKQLKLPVLFIHGDDDQVTPQASINHFAAVVPNVQVYRIKDAGHLVYIEKATEVCAIHKSFLRYISKLD